MGWETPKVEVSITCHVSRHNSPRDAADDALVKELARQVRGAVRPIVADPRYAELILDVAGLEGHDE